MRFNSERPIFAQIVDLLAQKIVDGELGPGDRLPSARELASSLEVNPNTAARALQELADSAFARCERGMGYFVSEKGPELARAARKKRFFSEELPRLFKRMDELGIGLGEISEMYAARGGRKERIQ
jgi:DNA-binding transcriptional regulator YhcF (GntR family)